MTRRPQVFGGYAGQLENFLDAVRGPVPLAVTGADGAAAVTLIDAIGRSLATRADVAIASQGLAA